MNCQNQTGQLSKAELLDRIKALPLDLRGKAIAHVRRLYGDHTVAMATPLSLVEFIRNAWPVIEPDVPYVHGRHIDAIAEHLEAVLRGEIRNLIICVPPRHSKSTVVAVMWPAWAWTRKPSVQWVFASYQRALSTRDSIRCRRLVESTWYQQRWGHLVRLRPDQNQKNRFENTAGGVRIATSVAGSGTGEGADITVADDPHNVTEALSESRRKMVHRWWDEVMSTRLNDPRTGARVIVMQRCHEDDLVGHLRSQGGYETLVLPARFEPPGCSTSIGWADWRRSAGELLFPERFPEKELEDLEGRLGSYAAAAQLQQRPAPAAGGMFRRHWWRYWSVDDFEPISVVRPDGGYEQISPVRLPEEFEEVVQSWDTTFKSSATSDWVVGQVWGRIGAVRYLLDQRRARMNLAATVEAVKEMRSRYPDTSAIYIEDKANGPAVIECLRGEVPGVIASQVHGGIISMANVAARAVEAGDVYIPHPSVHGWVQNFIDEHATFPRGRHDDTVAAHAHAAVRLACRIRPCDLWGGGVQDGEL